MTTKIISLAIAIGLAPFPILRGQQPDTPAASPSATPSRSVRLSFVPPPMEGTISLGIYDEDDQLVRVLHQEAEFDQFSIGADALTTKWDGKDDYGYDVPPGKYSGRGFLIGAVKAEDVGSVATAAGENSNSVGVKLVPNPLENNERPIVELGVGFDDENAFLKAADGLPLVTIAPAGDTKRAWLTQRNDKSLDAFLDNGTSVRQFHLSGVSKMMAFDCGEFELK
ncbi:MAG TPA: hypothetical protein VGH08_08050 [Chthoniobacterales bacterium]|jgi:hypothetical protein